MKKISYFLALILLFSKNMDAQTWGSTTIPTTTTGDCTVGGNLNLQSGLFNMTMPIDADRTIIANSSTKAFNLLSGHSGTDGAYIGISALGAPDPGAIHFHSIGSASGGFVFFNYDLGTASFNQQMSIKGGTGLVNINNNLSVNGGIVDLQMPIEADRTIIANSSTKAFNLLSGHSGTDGAYIGISALGAPDPGAIHFHSIGSASGGFVFFNYDLGTASFNQQMSIKGGTGLVNINNNLSVNGGIVDLQMPIEADRTIIANSSTKAFNLLSGHSGYDGAYIGLSSIGAPDPGAIHFHTMGAAGGGFVFFNITDGIIQQQMKISPNGKILIGSPGITTPGDYLLYVQSGIMTEKLNVAIAGTGNWSDYVFNKDYPLMPLKELESYLNKNKHLPEVPAANEVVKDGIDVAKMDAKLLQKIEELTLYAIEQQKQSEQLKKAITEQQKEIDELKKIK